MTAVDLVEFGDVRAAWQRLVDAGAALPSSTVHSAHWGAAVEEMLRVQRRLAQEGRWSAGPTSLMEVLELERHEVANCKVLRWLLDPIARHGLGAQLIRALAEHIKAEHIEFVVTDATTCSVETEVSRNGTRADIVITGLDGEVMVVEAKIDAGEQTRQAERLEQQWPEASAFVFLTNDGARLPLTRSDSDQWTAISWRWFADKALHLIELDATSDPLVAQARLTIRTWAHSIRRNLG